MAATLDEQQLLALASERFGPDVLEPAFAPAFSALCHALRQEARLSPTGVERVTAQLLAALGERADLRALEQRVPSLSEIPVARPIVITGFPRTGTTLLHNLLARVEGLWAPPLWQLRRPARPASALDAGTGADWDTQEREATAAMLDTLYSAAPSFRSIHPMDPEWPDQCNWLLRKSFSTLANAFSWFVPGYVQYLCTTDMRPAYADHQRWLRALLHRHAEAHPEAGVPRLALKDPFHMWQLQALLAVYPDATIIQLHRDPAEVVPSFASLCATLQTVDSDSPRRPAEIGSFCLFILGHGLRALERARQTHAPDRFIDLSYRELVASPGAVLLKLGAALGFDASGVAVEEAKTWLDNNEQRGRPHRYALDDFGLSNESVDEYVDEYRARFGGLL